MSAKLARLTYICTLVAFLANCWAPAEALEPTRPLRSLNRQVWDTETGLPQNTVLSIAQDASGYLWIATDAGLVRFNGAEFKTFNKANTPAIKSDRVRHVFVDAAGTLWISTSNGLLHKDSAQGEQFSPQAGLPDEDVSFVAQDRSGALRIATASAVSRLKDGKLTSFPMRNAESLAFTSDAAWLGNSDGLAEIQGDSLRQSWKIPALRAVCSDTRGQIWVATRDGLLNFSNSAALQPKTAPESARVRDVTALLCDHAGRVWAGTGAGVWLLEQGKASAITTANGLPGERIHSLHEDAAGAIWISTNRGLVRWFDGAMSGAAARGSDSEGVIPVSAVLSMYDDHEGDLWLATDADGLQVLRDRRFLAYNTKQGLPDDRVSAVLQDPSGTVWVGTKESGLSAYRDGAFRNYSSANGLASNVVLALASDTQGRLWIGTPDGLNIFDHGRFSLLTSADGLADDFVRSLYQDSSGAMWIGTRRGLSRFQNQKFTTFTTADGLPSDLIGALLEDHEHNLWIGTMRGLSRFHDGKFTSVTNAGGLSANAVTSLHEDEQGNLWIGTEGGLFRLRSGKAFSYAKHTDLPEAIYAIVEDASLPDRSLWLASPQGIYRVSLDSLNAVAEGQSTQLKVSAYGTADGMPTRECTSGAHPAAWRLQDGSLWFSTVKGIAAVQPSALRANTVPPPVAIEQVIVDDVAKSPAAAQQISAGHSRLSFAFAAMSYVAPEKIRYKYKLEGVDADWVPTAERKSATYTNLRPGSYTFHVIAANNDGVWNTAGAALEFRLKPAFYQTLWFYALCLLALVLLAYQIYQMRIRFVRARFSAVLEERQRIAREIHDTLAQGFVGISVQLELISRLLAAAPEQAREQLDSTRRLVRESIAEARRSIWNLRSADEVSLAAALAALVKRLTGGTDIHATFNVTGQNHPLPKVVEEELLKIAQEAITNSIRHSHAKNVAVELSFASIVRLTVRDDGTGFDVRSLSNGARGHYGLTGMRERARKINAELTIQSTPGEGTSVVVEAQVRALEELQVQHSQ